MEKLKNRKSITRKNNEPDKRKKQKQYNQHLISKLEERIIDLEKEITSRQRIENKLKESEEKYKTLFDVTQEAIFIGDIENGIILDCNKAACALVERSREELIGKHQSILHPADELVDGYTKSFREHFTNDPQRVLNARVITKSGAIKNVEIKANIINVKGEKIIQGFFNDITERKQFEDALLKEQYLFNNLIDTIPDNIYFKDRKSRFIRINKPMAKRFGLNDPEEAIGKTDFDFFDEEHARPAFEDEQRIIATGEPIVGLEEKEVWPDGHITWVSTTKLLLRDKIGSVMGIMGLSRDITDRKKIQARI
jgi:PAS domain S-box-containing protein